MKPNYKHCKELYEALDLEGSKKGLLSISIVLLSINVRSYTVENS